MSKVSVGFTVLISFELDSETLEKYLKYTKLEDLYLNIPYATMVGSDNNPIPTTKMSYETIADETVTIMR